jgi:hypothetical protein
MDYGVWTFTPSGWTPDFTFTPTNLDDFTPSGSVPIQWIVGEDGIDWSNYPKITIHCLAFGDNKDVYMNDARRYVSMFFAMSSEEITNEALYKGGSDLQTSPANQLITITEGNGTGGYNQGIGALYIPKFTEKSYAKIGGQYYIPSLDLYTNSVIEFDLEIELQLPNAIHP